MKILHYLWASYYEKDILEIYHEKNISYDIIEWNFKSKNCDEEFLAFINKSFDFHQYDLMFSVNYWPLLSDVCQKHGLPYISWCYDNPLNVRDIQSTLGNPVNRVYCFDRVQAEGYKKQGFQTVFHLPLAVNVKRLSRISSSDPACLSYQSEVSFVGKLYESAIDYILGNIDEYCKGYLQAILNAQSNLYGAYIISDLVTEDLLSKINASLAANNSTAILSLKADELIYALSCEVTRRNRIVLLSLCGNRFQTKFFSYNDSSIIQGAEKLPAVDYWTEMPYIFAASKINLNPSLCAIQTGIPLRALDIMGCGGFLLSNYQAELAEYYIPDSELVLYESLPDAIDKINFYLKNEDVRAEIAVRGRQTTFKYFDMNDRLAYMFHDWT